MTNSEIRKEAEIFEELETLCTSPGYAHAIAYFCFRDNMIRYKAQVHVEDVLQQFSEERLVRTEISTLIGLALKSEFDVRLPSSALLQEYISKTEDLLNLIHQSMMHQISKDLFPIHQTDPEFNPFTSGNVLREAIFYGGEGAYHFQYKDLFVKKYENDDEWFLQNKGYSLKQANSITSAILNIQNAKANSILSHLAGKKPDEWTLLPVFSFTTDEVTLKSGEDKTIVKAFINSFVAPVGPNENLFSALDDFNPSNAYPIIKIDEDNFLLFQNYSLVEALYETPFFWLIEDEQYKKVALKNRGNFTEQFSRERLEKVFGEERVFTNIDVYKNKKTKVGEIDVLVIFSDRAIILQAKSKRLTIESRKGNDNSLKNDFKKAVQDSYDQAFLCAGFLNDENYRLIDSNGTELHIFRSYKEIYPFCVVSDYYPSLSFQADQFLRYQQTESIMPPFVMDVFFLDVVTEMLQSPLYFLSYVNRRVQYNEKILSAHEMTILSYHLKTNLWVDDEHSLIYLDDDICADLDLAMLTRRDKILGIATPEGILTRHKDTHFSKLIDEINKRDDLGIVDLGFMLLALDEHSVVQLNQGILKLLELTKSDGKNHDLTIGIDKGKIGLTIHCNDDDASASRLNLKNHCLYRKYMQEANTWFGICINPKTSQIRFGISLKFDWVQSSLMNDLIASHPNFSA